MSEESARLLAVEERVGGRCAATAVKDVPRANVATMRHTIRRYVSRSREKNDAEERDGHASDLHEAILSTIGLITNDLDKVSELTRCESR